MIQQNGVPWDYWEVEGVAQPLPFKAFWTPQGECCWHQAQSCAHSYKHQCAWWSFSQWEHLQNVSFLLIDFILPRLFLNRIWNYWVCGAYISIGAVLQVTKCQWMTQKTPSGLPHINIANQKHNSSIIKCLNFSFLNIINENNNKNIYLSWECSLSGWFSGLGRVMTIRESQIPWVSHLPCLLKNADSRLLFRSSSKYSGGEAWKCMHFQN